MFNFMFNSPLYNGRNKMARHKVEICGVNTANIKVLSSEEVDGSFHARFTTMAREYRYFANRLFLLLSIPLFEKIQDVLYYRSHVIVLVFSKATTEDDILLLIS